MAPQSIHLEEILYDSLLGIEDPRARADFLDQTCQGNPQLRARLEKLVSVHERAERFFNTHLEVGARDFDSPLPPAGEPAPQEEGLGTMIGRYRLVSRLGEGGCGAVYQAEQTEPVRRKVALKIIRVGLGTAHVIERFERERQALALMDHPNIARVFDAGTTSSGRPFFVMQLVDGPPITRFCDEHRLDLPARLQLFVSVCRAIQHAHQKGVIHCDIKPSNVIVSMHDGVAVPKVIDFGIARATEGEAAGTGEAATPPLVGTPAYMSPEQLDGNGADVDTRSDIYSMGALLYELLTGAPPRDAALYSTAATGEIRSLLRSETIPKPSERLRDLPQEERETHGAARRSDPSRLWRLLKGDLDAIVMKAMHPDRRQRYGAASEFAADLTHFLQMEPVHARNGGRRYRLRKLVRRNKILFAAGTVAVLALTAGFGASTVLFFRESRARQEQARLRDTAERARAEEEKLREKAQAGELVAHAAVLIGRGDIAHADELLAKVDMADVPVSLESANTYRAAGEWLLREGRLAEAAQRFAAVAQSISRVDKSDSESISIHFVAAAAAVLDAGDLEHYEELRQMAADRFSNTPHAIIADEVVKSCLVAPAEPSLLAKLDPLIEVIERSLPWDKEDAPHELMEAWQMLSVTMAAYRREDFSKAEAWARRTLRHPNTLASRSAAAGSLLAMALHRSGRGKEAEAEFAAADVLIQSYFRESNRFDPGWTDQGFWFDWLIARLLHREARSVLDR